MIEKSTLRNPESAEEGWRKIQWVADKMDILNEILKEHKDSQPFAGKKVAICLHLEAKTAYMAYVISQLGADVAIAGSNPLSTQDDVAAGLAAQGVMVHSWYGSTPEEYKEHLNKVLNIEPDFIIDDGGDMVETLHTERQELLENIIGGAEETTTGIHRLEAMEGDGTLAFPMMAVNDAKCKSLFDNRYGTGQSVWDGIMRTTNLVVAGKTAVVAGYGWCGKGVAMRAKGLGARVIVTEIDPVKASEAWMDGFEVMPMREAAKKGDFFITVTGCRDVIDEEDLRVMKDGAIMCNAGHFDVEVSKSALNKLAVEVSEARKNIRKFEMEDGRKIYLLADGRLVNLAAGDGHPAEIMDMTFALQLSSLLYLNHNQNLDAQVYNIPDDIDNMVAEYKLQSLGLEIDQLTEEQEAYINSWENEK
jgi:adenosylhomocysteinase